MDSIKLLQRLVQIPSPNPPGDTRAMADFVAEGNARHRLPGAYAGAGGQTRSA